MPLHALIAPRRRRAPESASARARTDRSPGREAVLFPGSLERAIEILYATENALWNGERDYAALELTVEPPDATSRAKRVGRVPAALRPARVRALAPAPRRPLSRRLARGARRAARALEALRVGQRRDLGRGSARALRAACASRPRCRRAAACAHRRASSRRALPPRQVTTRSSTSIAISCAGRARPRPSAARRRRALAVTARMPSATQLPKKMSANDSPTSALMPQRCSACGACSREEPQPKFLFTTRIDAPRKRGSSIGWPFGSPSASKRTSRKTNSSRPVEGDRRHEARRDDPVGVDVVAAHDGRRGRAAPSDARQLAHLRSSHHLAHVGDACPRSRPRRPSPGSSAGCGPVGLPCRPLKLRFELDAQTSRPTSLSGFIARHIEQPASRHSKPALLKISCRPSRSAARAPPPSPARPAPSRPAPPCRRARPARPRADRRCARWCTSR